MIVKHNLSPARIVGYVWQPMLYTVVVASAVAVAYEVTDWSRSAIPFAPVGMLGSAMAIFVAFRNNAGFARWWDARTSWQAIHNSSRIFARHLVAFTDDAAQSGRATREQAAAYATELVGRQIGFVYLLAHQLRGTDPWPEVNKWIGAAEIDALRRAPNPANRLLITQGIRLKDGIRDGLLGQFDPISIEPNFGQFSIQQGLLERIKHTPTPRQYEYFTRLFVLMFATVLPFALLSVFPTTWMVIPASTLLAGVFVIMANVGTANEDPMENRTTDVPITAICTNIERDLCDALGDTDLPALPTATNGYLW
jgi:ion channel-forming bestrophin family protein